jgi:RNA polymerase sigma-70 factor, ECF subfamily
MTMLRTQGDAGWCEVIADDDVDIDRDRVLVTRAQSGDRAAFDDLYARYYRRLWRFCLKRLHDEHEAEDVAQEAFVRAWQALPGFAGERRFYPWLSVIAAHLCSNVVRKRNRSDPVSEFHDRNIASWEDVGEDHVLSAHDGALAAKAFAQLSPRHQAILDMRETLGWSYQRIAEHEGVRVTTVESLLWRARTALKREFVAQGGEGKLAGFFGVVTITIRRWFRTPEAILERTGGLAPSTTSLVVTSAAAAATTLAAIVGSITPSLVSPNSAPSSPDQGLAAAAPATAFGGSGPRLPGPSYGSAGVPMPIGPGGALRYSGGGTNSGSTGTSANSGTSPSGGGQGIPSVPPAPGLPGSPDVPSGPSVPSGTPAPPGTPDTPSPPSAGNPSPPPAPDPVQTVTTVAGTGQGGTTGGSVQPPTNPTLPSLPPAPTAPTLPSAPPAATAPTS